MGLTNPIFVLLACIGVLALLCIWWGSDLRRARERADALDNEIRMLRYILTQERVVSRYTFGRYAECKRELDALKAQLDSTEEVNTE